MPERESGHEDEDQHTPPDPFSTDEGGVLYDDEAEAEAGNGDEGAASSGGGWRRSLLILAVVALVAGVVGVAVVILGDDDNGVIESLAAAEQATVLIESDNQFARPRAFSDFASFGTGTGFVVDESGLAVTNNHVVAGGGRLRVRIAGEQDPRSAAVVGRSECHDLAVIDIEGDGFPALEWSDVELRNGLDVYAAGYPEGDSEYVTSRGIVSRPDTGAETEWASVDRMIEHDAGVRAASAGGPLLTAEGKAIGLNLASNGRGASSLAVHRDVVRDLIGQLADGKDAASIGINGEAVASDDGSLSGIWVAGVVAKSPAARVGIEPGDVITRLGGETMASTGTMAEFCEVVRRHAADAQADEPLRVEVLRFENRRVLKGAINGDELARAVSFRTEFADAVTAGSADAATPPQVETVSDRSKTLRAAIPAQWGDTSGAPLVTPEGQELPQIKAAPSIEEFDSSYTAPGVALIFVPNAGEAEVPTLLDAFAGEIEADCTNRTREEYSNRGYTGRFDAYQDCADSGNAAFVIAAVPPSGRFVVVIAANVVSRSDLAALDSALDTFKVSRP